MKRNLLQEDYTASCEANAVITDAQTKAAVMLAKLEMELALR